MLPRRHGTLTFILFWCVVFVMLVFWFERKVEDRINPNRAVLLAEQDREVVLMKNAHGQYLAEGYINDILVTMVVDTGASFVALPEDLAKGIGVRYTGKTSRIGTANGEVVGKHITLDRLQLGSLLFFDVSGVTVPDIEADTILLGMNVLDDLNIQVSGDTMRMIPLAVRED